MFAIHSTACLTVPEATVEVWWRLSNCQLSEAGQAAHYAMVAGKCSGASPSQDGGASSATTGRPNSDATE